MKSEKIKIKLREKYFEDEEEEANLKEFLKKYEEEFMTQINLIILIIKNINFLKDTKTSE